jgi:hypothetical protein
MIPTETRERFILDFERQLAGAEVMEVHFFAPRRVGGVESAIAVVAAAMPAPDPIETPSLEDTPYAPDPDVPPRYTVYTATYRHTLKGPDRGKWEVTVKAEADAPLVTVDQVVRGVQRRAEDTELVERISGDEIRAIVDAHREAPLPTQG